MNVQAVAVNVLTVATNRMRRVGRHTWRRVQRLWRIGRNTASGPWHASRRAVAAAAALPSRADKAVTRVRKRSKRFREHVLEPWLEQREIEGRLARLAGGHGPIVVGPWLSEVGYEVLYWRPFLTWMCDRYRIDPSRVIAVSRGGAAAWYGGIAARYVELLNLFSPDEFAVRNAARHGSGDQKQLTPGDFDAEIMRRVATEYLDGPAVRLCHPSLMFRLFRRFWFGDRSLDFFLNHMRFEPMAPPRGHTVALPPRFAAVKFYTGSAVPDTADHRRMLRALVVRLAESMPVVVLSTGLSLDEHRDFLFEGIPNVSSVIDPLKPATNLAVQTEVIARASLFVGTCGSLAWLAPMVGTPTVGVYADDRFLAPHLFVARHAYRLMRAASFTTLDLAAVDALDLAPVAADSRITYRAQA